MSFNNLNLPADFLNSVRGVLSKSQEDFNIPQVLVETAKAMTDDYRNCLTLEDCRTLVATRFSEVVDRDNLEFDTATVVNFERAVRHYVSVSKNI